MAADDRAEIAEIIESFSNLNHNDADHLAGMITAAGFTKTTTEETP